VLQLQPQTWRLLIRSALSPVPAHKLTPANEARPGPCGGYHAKGYPYRDLTIRVLSRKRLFAPIISLGQTYWLLSQEFERAEHGFERAMYLLGIEALHSAWGIVSEV